MDKKTVGGMALANFALLPSLMFGLQQKGVLSQDEVKEILEEALLTVEQTWGAASDPQSRDQVDVALKLLRGAIDTGFGRKPG